MMSFLRLKENLTRKNSDDEFFAAKSKFDKVIFLLSNLRISEYLTWNNFYKEYFAAQSDFDLE